MPKLKLKKLKLKQVLASDREYFAQHPDLDYYIRPITEPEILQGRKLGQDVDATARVLVGSPLLGVRIRLTCMDASIDVALREFRASMEALGALGALVEPSKKRQPLY